MGDHNRRRRHRGRGPRQNNGAGGNLQGVGNRGRENPAAGPVEVDQGGGFQGRRPRQNYEARGNLQGVGYRGARNPGALQQGEAENQQVDEIHGHARRADPWVPRPMGARRMRELEARGSTEVMLTLLDDREGFKLLIELKDLDRNQIGLILVLLARACNSDQMENLKALLRSVHSVHQFSFISLQLYLCDLRNANFARQPEAALGNLLSLLETTQKLEPETVTMNLLLPHLKETFTILEPRISQALKTRFDVLQDQFNKKCSVTFLSQKEYDPPPNDFRTIPIFPDSEDLKGKRPFLRPNVVEGRYKDTEDYLDVQFRLLREDFVRPLREGIAAHVHQIKTNKTKRLQNIRVYNNVHLQEASMTDDGIIQEVNFDVTPFRNIRWETNRRLIFGSLLCFSHNNFETMTFATVAIRNPPDLAKGKFHVKFEDLSSLPVTENATYVMLETEAYFEAYRHNLMALQFMDERLLPCKEHFVELSIDVPPPTYLKRNTKYCLQPLLKKFSDSKVKDGLVHHASTHTDVDMSGCGFYRPCKYTDVLNDSNWPTFTDMGLDPSQYGAFKLALTNQLTIIQGPPGTGKTYVGLKIIQALFHNHEIWKADGQIGQILIICYTNHALDQFLEGVLTFTDSVVRIGGRSQNERLSQYTIRQLKRKIISERKRARYILRNELGVKHELEEIVKDHDKLQKNVKCIRNSILTENVLEEVIESNHLRSLHHDCPSDMRTCKPKLLYWLGLEALGVPESNESDEDKEDDGVNNSGAVSDDGSQDDDYENAGDVDFINDLRTEGNEFNNPQIFTARGRVREVSFNNAAGEWQVQGGKKLKKRLMQRLKNYPLMPDEDIDQVNDVWELSLDNRWRLYKAWIAKFEEQAIRRLEELNKDYQRKLKMAEELRCEEDFLIAKDKRVIGMTTTGAAKFRSLLWKLKPKIVIVEEAAEVLEAHIVTALTEGTQHLILIGDHQQLRPNPTVYELATRFNLDVSLFERLINNGIPFRRLGIQHRMKPCISKLIVPYIYDSLADHESVKEYEDIKGTEKSMFFINHKVKELTENDSTSKVNLHEAEFLQKFCRYLLLQGYAPNQITILATYAGQFSCLKRIMIDKIYQGVRVTVVDNYQGEECDIILLTLVRSNDEGNVGFLKVGNRVCVALSRAKKGLFCIGNFDLLRTKSDLWENIHGELLRQEAVGPSLHLRCQNHGNVTAIKVPADFQNVINGGCSEPCDFRLDCGHSCGRLCHPYDADHIEYRCNKPCTKIICSLEHRCPMLCHQPCLECIVPVVKVLPKCGHEARAPCHLDASLIKCLQRCTKVLDCGHKCPLLCSQKCGVCKVFVNVKGPCGHDVRVQCSISSDVNVVRISCRRKCTKQLPCKHPCTNPCGQDCAIACKVLVQHPSPCGHSVKIACHAKASEEKLHAACTHPCGKELECGHLCAGTCSLCHQGRIHVPCQQRCQKLLVCGHVCVSPCSSNCPPCSRPCENRCSHSKCQRRCGAPCLPCIEQCAWECEHQKCTKTCGEPCDRRPCNLPCSKLLACEHPCIGLCGEPCPKKCLVCDREEVTEIMFGDEDEPLARFIQLEDCHHIFESNGLAQWIENMKSGEIQLPSCPRCKTPIRRNLHFNTYVKSCMAKVELVKMKNFGYQGKNHNKRMELRTTLSTDQPRLWEICKLPKAKRDQELAMEKINFVSEIVTRIIDQLSPKGREMVSMTILVQMENFMAFVRQLKSIEQTLLESKNIIRGTFSQHVVSSLSNVTAAIKTNFLVVSTQLLEDINWELHRISLLTGFLKQLEKKCEETKHLELKRLFALATGIMTKRSPFRTEQVKAIEDIKKEMQQFGMAEIHISDEDKFEILKAMGLKQGHWFSCPNGHVYCITECGGAMEEGVCNECGARIGGGSHALRSDNRVATDMDGARHGAWSDANNMENFDLEGLL